MFRLSVTLASPLLAQSAVARLLGPTRKDIQRPPDQNHSHAY